MLTSTDEAQLRTIARLKDDPYLAYVNTVARLMGCLKPPATRICRIILRGGAEPEFTSEEIATATRLLNEAGVPLSNKPPALSKRETIKQLQAENEQLRLQLAACATAASGWNQKPAMQGDYAWSPAYQDVLTLRRQYEGLLNG